MATSCAIVSRGCVAPIDPVRLRLQNEPERDLGLNVPYSSRHYTECLTLGAEKFGWRDRSPEIGSMRSGDVVLGWGVAGASWIAERFAAESRANLVAQIERRGQAAQDKIAQAEAAAMNEIRALAANAAAGAAEKLIAARMDEKRAAILIESSIADLGGKLN